MTEADARMKRRSPIFRRWIRRLFWPAAGAFVLLNAVAFFHARAMLFFIEAGRRTPKIEQLSAIQKAGVLLTGVRIPKPGNYRSPAGEGLVFETIALREPGRPDLEAWRIPCENPRGTIAMFHGYSDCKSSLVPAAREFHDLGYEVWLTDFRGCGGSAGNSTSLGWHEADDVRRLADFLRTQNAPRPLVLYGFSMGGAAILRAVADLGVKPAGIVICSVFDTMLGAVQARFHSMGVPAFPAAQCLTFWGGVQQDMNAFANNPVDFAARVKCPALLMHGSADVRAPLAQGSNVFARLAGPKRMVVFDGAGHGPLERSDPARWRKEIAAWLDTDVAAADRHR